MVPPNGPALVEPGKLQGMKATQEEYRVRIPLVLAKRLLKTLDGKVQLPDLTIENAKLKVDFPVQVFDLPVA